MNARPQAPTPTPHLSDEALVAIRVAHLGMIQGVIGRMSGYSANLKNYAITVVAALLAVYSQKPDTSIILFAIAPVMAFALLDAHYLRLERSFRGLYQKVSREPLDTSRTFDICPAMAPSQGLTQVLRSWSVLSFYLPLLIGLAVFFTIERFVR